MKRFAVAVSVCVVLVASLFVAACGGTKVPAGSVAALKGGVSVTQAQYDEILGQAKTQMTQGGKIPFPKEDTEQHKQIRASIVSYLVRSAVIGEVAKSDSVKVMIDGKAVEVPMKVSVGDKEYKEYRTQLVANVGGEKKFKKLLATQGIKEESFVQQVKAQLLEQAVQRKVIEQIKVNDAEIKEYYEKNKAQFVTGPTVTARHVLVKTEAKAKEVQALLAADNTDANWARVAKKYSEDTGTKSTGGSLGEFGKGQMAVEFEKAAFALKKGEISKPVKTQFGWHIIGVTGTAKGSEQTLEQAKPSIEQQLLYTKQTEVWKNWLEKAQKDDYKVGYAPGYNPDELTGSPSPDAKK